MELMDKDAKEEGAIGVSDLQRWPTGSDAVGFLSATTSTDWLDELMKVSFRRQCATICGLLTRSSIRS